MLAPVLLLIALVAGFIGLGGIAELSADLGQALFFLFLGCLVAVLIGTMTPPPDATE